MLWFMISVFGVKIRVDFSVVFKILIGFELV